MEFIDLKKQYNDIAAGLGRRLGSVMSGTRFIFGEETEELEVRLAAYTGRKHCISCSSGTDALLMPLMAWQAGKGDAVFVPAFTFFATAEVASMLGAEVVFVDIEPGTFNMDPAKLRKAAERVKAEGRLRLRAVIAADIFGQPARNPEIEGLAAEYGMFFLEDAAQGFGGRIGSRAAGSFGDAAATSFFPAKPLGCYGDGGAVFTDSDELAGLLRSIRVHGQGREKYQNVRIGLNARLDNMQAAVLLEKLTVFDKETAAKNVIAERYSAALAGLLETPAVLPGYYSSWAQYSLLAEGPEEREFIIGRLKSQGVPTAIYYKAPLHEQPVYKGYDRRGDDLSASERICKRVFSIPMHAYLSDADIELITGTIAKACAEYRGDAHSA
ncbi:MAG: DegT/DnrJ/EryC1/StrS family aminotransferase [Clostridiales Family XIII bacterium]|nr:DegT/DnrJ/EryC1/StrS family aminotransferase [Clostridiales Family XIII bacterium]